MNRIEFDTQMKRLSTQWPTAYSVERAVLIWEAVRDLSEMDFRQVVNRLIGEQRQAPMLPEIREQIAKHREKNWASEKHQNAQDAKDFIRSTLPPEEKKNISQTILQRLRGSMNDTDWEKFQRALKNVSGGS